MGINTFYLQKSWCLIFIAYQQLLIVDLDDRMFTCILDERYRREHVERCFRNSVQLLFLSNAFFYFLCINYVSATCTRLYKSYFFQIWGYSSAPSVAIITITENEGNKRLDKLSTVK